MNFAILMIIAYQSLQNGHGRRIVLVLIQKNSFGPEIFKLCNTTQQSFISSVLFVDINI